MVPLSLRQTFRKIRSLGPLNLAVYNAAGGGGEGRKYFKAPFLTIPAAAYESYWQTSTFDRYIYLVLIRSKGGFMFAQQAITLLLETAKTNPKYPATLLFTGATASIKASAGFSAFASAKSALRSLSQSLAKEFGPQAVHIGHVIADGVFDTPIRREAQPEGDEGLMSPDSMAQSYWSLHIQPKGAWSWEIDLRPYLVHLMRGCN